MPQPLYIFDMDDTLVAGDCSMLWNQYLFDKGVATLPDFLETDRKLMALYAIGKLDMEEYMEYVMQPLAGIPQQEVDNMVDDFVATRVAPLIYPEAISLIRSLSEKQVPMLVISATASFIVRKVAQSLGIHHVIGIDMAEDNGGYGAEIVGIPSYREGKIARLKVWQEEQKQPFSETHFYTDSINDLPLCEYADYAYLINPCAQLKEAAKDKPWVVYHWGKEKQDLLVGAKG